MSGRDYVQDVMQKYSSTWPAEVWSEAYAKALAYVFELPHARTVESEDSQEMVKSTPHSLPIRVEPAR